MRLLRRSLASRPGGLFLQHQQQQWYNGLSCSERRSQITYGELLECGTRAASVTVTVMCWCSPIELQKSCQSALVRTSEGPKSLNTAMRLISKLFLQAAWCLMRTVQMRHHAWRE